MGFGSIDVWIIIGYLVLMSLVGFAVKKMATKSTDSFFLADRKVPWWMLGLAGCSSYIDIGGTMAMAAMIFYLGMKSMWMIHIVWGFFIMAFFMAFQAKWIRRSGVTTFAEWNRTRFGANQDAERARLAAAIFVLVLMVFNFTIIAVGTGKFAAEFLPMEPWLSTLLIFAAVGVYVTLGGFVSVIITDVFQTLLIAVGAGILGYMAYNDAGATQALAHKAPEWSSLALSWKLWPSFVQETTKAYQHYSYFGPFMLAGMFWLIFRILGGPNVWDFQFFLTVRSPRDASLSAGMWTVGHTIRWVVACAFVLLGMSYLGIGKGFDGERILPAVLSRLPVGLKGVFIAVMLAALMSTVSAMANMLSCVVVNDFVRRYISKNKTEKQLVRVGQIASAVALFVGFALSLKFTSVVSIWETTIFVVVTTILIPSTFRWHWWRFSAKAFVWGMIASAAIVLAQVVLFPGWSKPVSLAMVVGACLVSTWIIGMLCKPTDMNVLVAFYSKIRPFGFWGPVRRESVKRGLVPPNDRMPAMDALNGLLCSGFQFAISLVPLCFFVRQWTMLYTWCGVLVGLGVILYFTWYRNLPPVDEDVRDAPAGA